MASALSTELRIISPGTGKTTALVESIRQVVDMQQGSRVLVCAPSNTATDLIATRLIDRYSPRELVRLNAPSRSYEAPPVPLRRYSPADGKTFKAPSGDELKKFRIVVCTCYYASIPRALGVKDHFTHIFVDEAGHASEPEIMVPILQNAATFTNVIVSGDVSPLSYLRTANLTVSLCNRCQPMQLGPVTQSKACIALDMDVSFLERVVKLPVYELKPGDTGFA
jgi:helicase MOV-10